MRNRGIVALLATSSLSLTLIQGVGLPASATSLGWCSSAPPTEACVVSATRNGVTVTESDPTYEIGVVDSASGGDWTLYWNVLPRGGGHLADSELGANWNIVLNTRGHVPRVAFMSSTIGTVTRGLSGVDNLVTVVGGPIRVTQGCDGSGVCPAVAATEFVALGGNIDEAATWYASSGVPVEAWNGANVWTNIDWTSFPPSLDASGNLVLQVANSHFRTDGTTPVVGFLRQQLPYSLVRTALFVDDPVSLVGGGVLATLSGSGGGIVTVSADDATRLVTIDASSVTFSRRSISVKRGVIVPRPGVVASLTRRGNGSTMRVSAAKGTPRGSRVIGYQARCYRLSGGVKSMVRVGYVAASKGRLISVYNVSRSASTYCQVRVRSKAGYGPWGVKKKAPRA